MALVFMDGSGDSKVSWKKKDNRRMVAEIQRLMDSGHAFHHLEYANNGAVAIEKPLESVTDLLERSVIMQDAALKELYENGTLKVVHTAFGRAMTLLRPLKTAQEVVRVVSSRPSAGYSSDVFCRPNFAGG